MSGHSKWATIKRAKAKTDAARGATFTKLSREIILAAKVGGGDPAGNFRLRTAIEKARAEGVPMDNIKRAIQKGVGGGADTEMEEIRYEGYGPGGVAVIVMALSNNRNRTAADVRSAFNKSGGNLGETGCVGWMFAEKGQLIIQNPEENIAEDDVMMAALEAGAEDVRNLEDAFEVISEPTELEAVQAALQQAGFKVESAEIAYIPSNTVDVEDSDTAKKLMKMLDALDELDDIQNVWANSIISDGILETLA